MANDNHDISGGEITAPVHAYDLAANQYDNWHWQEFWRKTETPFFDDCVESHDFIARIRMLDAGCGTGYYADRYGLLFGETYGIDPSVGMLEIASAKMPETHFAIGSLAPLPYASGMFDLVTCARVFSHVEDVSSAVLELVRVTAPGGLLLISNIDEGHRYTSTRLPSERGDVFAQTFKHQKRDFLAHLTAAGLLIGPTNVISSDQHVYADQGRFPEDVSSSVAWCLAAKVPH